MRSVRTSLSHPLQIDTLSIDGILGLTLCPGKTDPYGLTASWRRDLTADVGVLCAQGRISIAYAAARNPELIGCTSDWRMSVPRKDAVRKT